LTRKYAGWIKVCLEAIGPNGIRGLALRVLEILTLVTPKWEDYDGSLPPPVAGELLKIAGGEIFIKRLHGAQALASALCTLVSRAPADGYVIQASPRSRPADNAERRMLRCIRNLAPAKLAATDWMDLSLQARAEVNIFDDPSGMRGLLRAVSYSFRSSGAAFPPGTTGFLYVHVPDMDHPISAQLRFRVVPRPDPTMFAAGHDLRSENGAVWSLWLPTLMQQSVGDALALIVARQDLVDRSVMDQWRSAGTTVEPKAQPRVPLVCPGSDPFLVNGQARFRINLGVGTPARKADFVLPPSLRDRLQSSEGDDCCSPLRYALLTNVACTIGRRLVKLELDDANRTYVLHVVKALNVQVPEKHRGVSSELKEGTVFCLGSGQRLWRMTQEMRERQSSVDSPRLQIPL
jgi:hypothetical protein